MLKIKCVFIFPTNFSETFLIVGRIQRDMITNIHRPSCKAAVLFTFQWNLIFFDRFSKNIQISDFMKIRPLGDERGGQTDLTKLIFAFRIVYESA